MSLHKPFVPVNICSFCSWVNTGMAASVCSLNHRSRRCFASTLFTERLPDKPRTTSPTVVLKRGIPGTVFSYHFSDFLPLPPLFAGLNCRLISKDAVTLTFFEDSTRLMSGFPSVITGCHITWFGVNTCM